MRTRASIIHALLGLGLLVAACAPRDQTIRIGAILPLTGDLSSYGVDSRKALELALDQQNAAGPVAGKKLQLMIEDSGGSSSRALASLNKLADVHGVVACLGPITSTEVLSLSPVANDKKLIMMSPSATSVDVTDAGAYIFRTINADTVETQAFAPYALGDLKLDTVAIIALRTKGTMSYANSFARAFTAQGGRVIAQEELAEGLPDYRLPITKVLGSRPAAVYLAGYSKEIGELVKQIRSLDPSVPLLSYQSAEDKRVVEIAGDAVDGLVFSSTTLPPAVLGEANARFQRDFSARFGKSPGVFAAEIYDAFNILAGALRRSAGDPASLLASLQGTADFDGASGRITFDSNGDVHKPVAVYRYSGTSPTFVEVIGGSR